jgi:hypothetical protein
MLVKRKPLGPKWIQQYIKERAIDVATARREGMYVVSDPGEQADLLNWDSPARGRGAAFFLPFRGPDGETADTYLGRFEHPRHDKDGEPIKYERTRGSEPKAHWTVRAVKALDDSDAPLFITESPIKAIAMTGAGFAAIGANGCWGCCRSQATYF